MFFARPTLSDFALACAYFAAASMMLALTRFDGGVAFLWVAGALLIPVLARRPRREWGTTMVICGVASCAATGLFGLGWPLALPMAVINLAEAYVGATLLVRYRAMRTPLGSLPWLSQFVLTVGVLAPGIAAIAAAAVISATGRPVLPTFIHFYAGHALGNITFIPLVTQVLLRDSRRTTPEAKGRRRLEAAGLLALVAGTTAAVFSQNELPLLFLPMLPIILATFRAGRSGAAASIVLLAIIGGGLTLLGKGPISLIDAPAGLRVQFLQFYLAATVLTILPVAADLRNRARLHRELRFSEERFRLLAEQVSDVIMHLNLDGTIRYVSPSIRKVGGYDHEALVGSQSRHLVAADDIDHVRQCHREVLLSAGQTIVFEYRGLLADGQERWFETRSRALLDRDGRPDGVISVLNDVTRRKAVETQLAQEALTDSLTGLPNRRAFRAEARRLVDAGEAAWVAIVDLDHFKRVNDTYGHDGGDAVLQAFATLARHQCGADAMVARLGGEEFAVLLAGAADPVDRIERLRRATAASGVDHGGRTIRVTISAGLARLGEDGIEDALKAADLALYEAKAGGRDQLALAA